MEGWSGADQAVLSSDASLGDKDTQAAVEDGQNIEAVQKANELSALGALFNLVRRQSTDGQLVTPADWESFDVVPSHMDAEAFEMFTYDYLEEQKALREDASKPEETLPTYKTATRAVGVPRMFEKAETETGKPSSADDLGSEDSATLSTEVDEIPDDNQDFMQEDLGFDIPEGFELVELEGELTLVPIEDDVESDALACDDISMLMGKQSYYLYSNTVMTDAYAHWAFLAREDDRIVTFVDCVRSESRTYPRPMAASGLKNDPFNMSDEDIEQTWSALRESGEYPDIETTVASNGEVFYYSTEHLSPSYAASLAEWHAVERAMYL